MRSLQSPFVIIIFSLFIIGSAEAAGTYRIDIESFNSTDAGIIFSNGPSFKTENAYTCTANMGATLSAAGVGSIVFDFMSPGTTTVLTTTLSTPRTCFNISSTAAATSTTDGNGTLQFNRRVTLTGAVSSETNFHGIFSCTGVGDSLSIVSGRTLISSNGIIPNMIRRTSAGSELSSLQVVSDYGTCGSTFFAQSVSRNDTFVREGNSAGTAGYVYPFNSSYTGNVNITVDTTNTTMVVNSGGDTVNIRIDLVRYSTLTSTTLLGDTVISKVAPNFGTGNGQILNTTEVTGLAPNELYLLVVNVHKNGAGAAGANFFSFPPKEVRIDINTRQPDYVCEIGECVNSSQNRICVDQSNQFPNTLDFQSCFVPGVEIANKTIGFESYYETQTLECVKNPYTCAFGAFPFGTDPTSIPVKLPVGWISENATVNNSGVKKLILRTIEMISTPNYHTEGYWALRLNYRPPQPDTVQNNDQVGPAQCENATLGNNNEIVGPLSNLTAVGTPLTFPTTHQAITFDYRKPDTNPENINMTPRLQYESTGFLCTSKACYGPCETEVRGDFIVTLLDNTTQTSAKTVPLVATTDWSRAIISFETLNLDPTHTYYLIFIIDPENGNVDVQPYSVIIDNVVVHSFSGSVSFGNNITCDGTPQCSGVDQFIGTLINGTCDFVVDLNNSVCFQQLQQQQQQQQQQSVQQPFDPIGGQATQDSLESTFGGAAPIAGFFLSVFGIWMLIWIGIGSALEIFIAIKGKSANGVIFFGMMLFGALAGTFINVSPGVSVVPVGAGVLIILFDAAFLVFIMRGTLGLGGK